MAYKWEENYEYNTTCCLRGIGILGGQSNHLCQQSNDRFLGRNRWAKTYGWRSPGVDLDPGCHYQIGDGQVIPIFGNVNVKLLRAKMGRRVDLFQLCGPNNEDGQKSVPLHTAFLSEQYTNIDFC